MRFNEWTISLFAHEAIKQTSIGSKVIVRVIYLYLFNQKNSNFVNKSTNLNKTRRHREVVLPNNKK